MQKSLTCLESVIRTSFKQFSNSFSFSGSCVVSDHTGQPLPPSHISDSSLSVSFLGPLKVVTDTCRLRTALKSCTIRDTLTYQLKALPNISSSSNILRKKISCCQTYSVYPLKRATVTKIKAIFFELKWSKYHRDDPLTHSGHDLLKVFLCKNLAAFTKLIY